jgi:HTH-type transcriptional regulator, glycine betaine synthesis regulator
MPSSPAKKRRADQGRQLASKKSPPHIATGLSPFQIQTIALCVRAADALSVPRSAGQVYGLLFSTPSPLNLDQMTELLHASRGGTWEGLDWLRQMGAVEKVFLPGVRKDHYRPEINLRKLASGILRLRIEPHLESGHDHLAALGQSITDTDPDAVFQRERLNKIAAWHRVVSELLPLVKQVAAE